MARAEGYELTREFRDRVIREGKMLSPLGDGQMIYKYMNKAPEDSLYFEVGAWNGGTAYAAFLTEKVGRAVLLDTWPYIRVKNHEGPRDRMEYCKQNLSPFVEDCVFIKGRSDDEENVRKAFDSIRGFNYGFMFIDGGHDYKSCKGDIENYVKKIIPIGGYVGFHDYVQGWDGVVRAVEELVDEGNFKDVDMAVRMIVLQRTK